MNIDSFPPDDAAVNYKEIVNDKEMPGKRTFNPLSKLSSYTYSISLYLLSPEGYSFFLENQGKNINVVSAALPGSIYTIIKGGGINTEDDARRGIPLDVYIDNLKVVSTLTPSKTSGYHNLTSLLFSVVEPLGYQFVTRLKIANEALLAQSKSFQGYTKDVNATRQHLVLGIEFQGYNPDGSPATTKDFNDIENLTSGSVSSLSGSSSDALFQRYYPITITDMKFKVDGRLTKYDIKAGLVNDLAAFGAKRGRITNNARVTASTLSEALDGVMQIMNKSEQDLYDDKKSTRKNEYNIVYRGPSGWEDSIKKAKMTDSDMKKFSADQLSMKFVSAARDVANQSFEEATRNTTPDENTREFSFRSGISIVQALTSLILRSSYVSDALLVKYSDNEQSSDSTESETPPNKSDVKPFIWFNIAPVVKPLGYCEERKDYVYNITYIIQAYETPDVIGSVVDKLPRYPGPHKIYNYFYSGNNTEVINFELIMNNAYFLTTYSLPGNTKKLGPEYAAQFATGVSTYPNRQQNSVASDEKNISQEPPNSFHNYLMDPQSQVKSKVQILGDPDYLMITYPFNLNQIYKRFYGSDDYTINANAGQVFMEILFREAVDWGANNDTLISEGKQPGLLTISDAITFFFNKESITKASDSNKISYRILSVESDFSGGKFTQTLDCVLNPMAYTQKSPSASSSAKGTSVVANQATVRAVDNAIESRNIGAGAGAGRGFVNPPLVSTSARPAMGAPSPTAAASLAASSRTIANVFTDAALQDARRPETSGVSLRTLSAGIAGSSLTGNPFLTSNPLLSSINPRQRR